RRQDEQQARARKTFRHPPPAHEALPSLCRHRFSPFAQETDAAMMRRPWLTNRYGHEARKRTEKRARPRRDRALSARSTACWNLTRTSLPHWRKEKLRCGDQTLSAGPPPGRRTVNTEPLPGSLVTVTSPPIMRASLRKMARPSPVPP